MEGDVTVQIVWTSLCVGRAVDAVKTLLLVVMTFVMRFLPTMTICKPIARTFLPAQGLDVAIHRYNVWENISTHGYDSSNHSIFDMFLTL